MPGKGTEWFPPNRSTVLSTIYNIICIICTKIIYSSLKPTPNNLIATYIKSLKPSTEAILSKAIYLHNLKMCISNSNLELVFRGREK